MPDYFESMSAFASDIIFENLPDKVIEQTKLCIADYYAASFAGYKINRTFNEAIIGVVKEVGGRKQSTILFEERKYPIQEAAFVNAVYSHGADLDDGNKKSAGHIGTHVIPSVFAIAEWLKSRWREVFVAINIGYEFFNRIAGAAQPDLYQRGFHSTGVAGAIACAAACSKLLGLDKNEIYNAVSIAAVQSSGLIIIDESGQGCKPINPGNAARIGVFSALLASKGIESPKNTLQSGKGWFYAYSGNQNPRMDFNDLGFNFTIMDSYLKLYPSCRHTHSCIDAVLKLRHKIYSGNEIEISKVKSVEVYIYPSAIKSAGHIVRPQNSDEAKFSIPYAVAVALYKGEFTLADLHIENTESVIFDILKEIVLIPEASMENRKRGVRGCRIVFKMEDGSSLETTIENPKGEGDSPLGWTDMKIKMIACSDALITTQEALQIIDYCKNLDVNKEFQSCFSIINKNVAGGRDKMNRMNKNSLGGGYSRTLIADTLVSFWARVAA